MSKKKRKHPQMPCSRCNGTGSVDLPYTQAKTLETIRGYGKKGINVAGLAEVCDAKYTTMCMRLTRLESLGLITVDRMAARHMIVKIKES